MKCSCIIFSPLFATFRNFSPLFTTFRHFSPLFTIPPPPPFPYFSPLFPLLTTFNYFLPLFPTFPRFSPLLATFRQFSPLVPTFLTFSHYSPLFPHFPPLSTTFHHFPPLSTTFLHFRPLFPTFHSQQNTSPMTFHMVYWFLPPWALRDLAWKWILVYFVITRRSWQWKKGWYYQKNLLQFAPSLERDRIRQLCQKRLSSDQNVSFRIRNQKHSLQDNTIIRTYSSTNQEHEEIAAA